jgi:hypothetical protein
MFNAKTQRRRDAKVFIRFSHVFALNTGVEAWYTRKNAKIMRSYSSEFSGKFGEGYG